MARSNSDKFRGLPAADRFRGLSADVVATADRVLLGGMALGTVLMLQPLWAGGLEWGFFLTLGSTILEIVTGHMLPENP